MLQKTRGIVFRFTKYGETSIIVNIFTDVFGLQSYIVNGVRSSSAKNQIALYQPLTLLDLVVYHRENANILRIKEVKCLYPYKTIYKDVKKSAIAMFLNEVVNKAVKDQSHTEELGQFLIDAFIKLDQIESAENFHLIFLVKLSRYLGFGAQTRDEVLAGWLVEEVDEKVLSALLTCDFDSPVTMHYESRKNILEALLRFYASHLDNFGDIKSVQVLKEMFN